jgi:DNA gyrase subunit B
MYAEKSCADVLLLSGSEADVGRLTERLRGWLAGESGRGRTVVIEASALQRSMIEERGALLAALHAGLRIVVRAGEGERVLQREGGLPSYLQEQLGSGRLPAVARFTAEGACEAGGVLEAEVALQWLPQGEGRVLSVVNDLPTPGHGTHLLGFVAGLSRALEEEGLDRDLLHYGMPALTKKRVLAGVGAVLRLEHPRPLYASPARTALSSKDALGLFEQVTYRKVRALCREHPGLIEALLERALGVPVGKPGEWRNRPRLDQVALG